MHIKTNEFRTVLLLSFFFFIACNSTKQLVSTSTEEIPATLLIKNVTLIDAKNGVRPGMNVFVKDNKILKIGAIESFKTPNTVQIINGTNKFLIPGLWDAHVHLSFIKELTPAMFKLFLAHGITSVRDTGGQLDLVLPERARARKDPKNSPRVMVAGPLLDGVPTVYDGSTPNNPHLGVGAKSVADAEKLAEEMIAAEVDLLKAYEMLTPEAFKAILAKGKLNGLPITGHVPLSMDVIEAAESGMSSMEHMRNLEFSCSSDWESLLQARQKMLFDGQAEIGSTLRRNIHTAQRSHAVANQDPIRRTKVLKSLAENGTWQIPTLSIMTVASERFFMRPDWQDSFKYLPSTVEANWRQGTNKFSETPVAEARSTYADWSFEMISHLKKANVEIMAGTDCPIFYLTPGYSLHEELALLVKGGLTPLEAIEAATLKPAEYFNMEKELGLIQEGMLADLLLLDANPLDDIRNTLKINAVVRDGKLHRRDALDAMLLELEKGDGKK